MSHFTSSLDHNYHTHPSPLPTLLVCPQARNSSALLKLHKIKYSREFKIYASEGVTFQQHVILWRFTLAHSPTVTQTRASYKKLLRVKNLLMLNTIELAHWLYSLEEQCGPIFKTKGLLFSGFAVKQFYSSDLKSIEIKCSSMIPNFAEQFQQWSDIIGAPSPLSPAELNQKYIEQISSTVTRKTKARAPLPASYRKYSEVSYKSDISTIEDYELRMESDMLTFETETMKGEKLSPIDDCFMLA